MLQEYNHIDQNLTLREMYNKYLHPDVLPIEDKKMWDVACSGTVLKLFQFDTQVGGNTIKSVKPTNPIEMSNCNSAMRLVAPEKGGETPTERIIRMKNDIGQWYSEMDKFGLTSKEQKVLEPYYLPANGMPAQQEDLMRILMDKGICRFSLSEANDARKICAKKQMDRIEELHKKVLEKATSEKLGIYVWETAIKPQMGYSFSLIHSLAYSYIGLQTIYLATYFPSVYWNTACLRVDSGLDEEASTNYGKIAKAVGNIMSRGINLSLIDINKSQYMFEPDEENDRIIYGMKALNGVGGDVIQEIIENRPYNGLDDFIEKTSANRTAIISLIKAGAFDNFGERSEIMKNYLWKICEPKKRITLQNFNGLAERNLIPDELEFEKRVFRFNKVWKKNCKIDGMLVLTSDNYYNFYNEFFDVDLLEPFGDKLAIKEEVWKKVYTKTMEPAKVYFKQHQQELLDLLNKNLFDEVWNKCAEGSYSKWEMDSLGMYYHDHELFNIQQSYYEIVDYEDLNQIPVVDYTFKRNGISIPIFKTNRIIGTVIDKDNTHSSISILTPRGTVVNVKMNRDYFAKYNRRIQDLNENGEKKVVETGWFKRGSLVILNGIRRGDLFLTKTYAKDRKNGKHQLYKITEVRPDGTMNFTNKRYGEFEEDEL